jgi:hypothetical protein
VTATSLRVTDSTYTPHTSSAAESSPAPRWHPTTLVAFRFCFVYLGLYVVLTQMLQGIVAIPKLDVPELGTLAPFRAAVKWIGAHLLGIAKPFPHALTGSGDRTFDWVQSFTFLLVAGIVTIVWSAIARRLTNHQRLYAWFRLFLRIALGTTMLTYGFIKLIPLQMPAPTLGRLLEPFGNFSPMGVLWASIGASRPYEMVVGTAEVMGGLLVMIPQTSRIGAILCLVDAADVFALNMTYDVPVKLFSFHLVLMSLFLLMMDAQPLVNLFLLGRTDALRPEPAVARSPRGQRIAVAAQIVFTLYIAGYFAWGNAKSWTQYGGGAPKPPLYGIWEVGEMTVDGVSRPPLLGDTLRWRRMYTYRAGQMAFQRMNDSIGGYVAKVDTTARQIVLTLARDSTLPKQTLAYSRPDADHLILDGPFFGHTVHAEAKLRPTNGFLLMSRGFHWVQEVPFNR